MSKEAVTEQKNRVIAEWLGWRQEVLRAADPRVQVWHVPSCGCGIGEYPRKCFKAEVPDFYSSEEASSLILEKLAKSLLDADHYFSVMWGGEWWRAAQMCDYHDGNADMPVKELAAYSIDRKTAIAEAAYQFITREESGV